MAFAANVAAGLVAAAAAASGYANYMNQLLSPTPSASCLLALLSSIQCRFSPAAAATARRLPDEELSLPLDNRLALLVKYQIGIRFMTFPLLSFYYGHSPICGALAPARHAAH
jgi:hypothetical protein